MRRRTATVIAFLFVGMGAAAGRSPTTPISGCKTDWNRSHPKSTGPSWPMPRSEGLQQLIFESSRQFHLACVDEAELTRIAELVAGQFGQESVLTFTYRPDDAPSADSFIAEVPG